MRILKRIIWGSIIFITITYVLPATLLQIPYFQEKISHEVASYLNKKLHTEVHIRQIEFEFFNKLILRDVYLEDLSGEVLFQAKRVAAGFEFFPLLQKKWRFDSIQLFTFQFNLSKETDNSPLNIQYIIDAFAKQDTTSVNPTIDLQIKKLNLRWGNFSYRVKDKAETPGKFNPKQLVLSDISSKIQIHNLNNRELSLDFNRLSFKEQSGLQMKNAAFDLVANEETAKINQLVIELDKSSLLFTDISAKYNLSAADANEEEPVTFQLKLKTSAIYPKELSAFIPALSHFDDRINLEGDFAGTGNDLTITNFYFRYYNQGMISANAEMRNIFHPNKELFYIRGNISNSFFSIEGIERLANNLSRQPIELPNQIKQMKTIRFEGDVNGSYDDLAAWGVLNTDMGIIRTNLMFGKNGTRFLRGQIASGGLNLAKFLNNPNYGEMAFDIRLDAKQDSNRKFFGSIDANVAKFVYKGYTYNNLTLNGEFSPTSFNGHLNLNSPEGKVSGEGLLVFNGKDSKFDFRVKVSDLQLDKLNLTNKYKQPLLSFGLNANLTGDNPDNFVGVVSLNDLRFETEEESYSLDHFQIASAPTEQGKYIRIDSEILAGEIQGNYSFKTIVPAMKQMFARYLPSLIKSDPKYSGNEEADFSIHLAMNDWTDFSKAFKIPFSLHGQTDISGQYAGDELHLDFTTDRAVFGGTKTDSLRLIFNASEKTAQADISGINIQKKDEKIKFDVRMVASDDQLNTLFHWVNGSSNYRGDLDLSTSFLKQDRSPVRIETNIRQTDLVFNDSVWILNPATVVIDSSDIRINHLQASHQDQFLKIDGAISHNPEEELQIELNQVDLEYIFQSMALQALDFGGKATGFVKAQDVFHTRKLETYLDVTDFSFNSVNFGRLNLTGTWDGENQGILMRGNAIRNDSSFVNVNGIIYPVKEELSIDFNAENADGRFLQKYVNQVIQNLTGNLSGRLRLFGDLNHPTVEGDVFAKNCRFGIEYLNTSYTFTDSVKCLPDTIKIKNITIYDEKGNKAIANGFVKHHAFKDFYYAATVSFSNFMVFNATKLLNPRFYGTAFGNGTASLYGTEDVANIDVTVQGTENTKITLNFMEEADVEDYDFIRFVSAKNSVADSEKKQKTTPVPVSTVASSESEIRLNLLMEANPQATIDLIMDPISDDKISGYGNGTLQLQYGTKIPLKVFGNYVIERGKYNFSFQQFFLRNFDISSGSSVSFRGDPYAAELDIKAIHTVNANLEDLDPRLIENQISARNNVPVNCILLLTGPLDRPSIAFDLDLPGATDDLVRQVKSYIRTDDMLNRQIIYLLVLSRFYTPPENMRGSYSAANSNLSYLTSALSTQLSSLLGSLTGNVQVGTVFNQSNAGSQTGTEFEVLLSSQLLNNRLIVNGNFGYANNPYINGSQNNIPLIGDFDIEYVLTKSGNIRLKGYNHYNFRNYYSITPEMTQGIGILFRKDFTRWKNLFRKNVTD
ncbi:MAG: translocation/assembly module TamB [Candidatus Azobacteroides sp.]|nr:translocation/assembly module TamB [Candidatus Azobacteroides sp.]